MGLRPSASSTSAGNKKGPVARASVLLTDVQLFEDGFVLFHISTTKVVEQFSSLIDRSHQTAAAMMVFFVSGEVACQFIDFRRQQGDLHFRRTCIEVRTLEFFNDLGF